MNTSYFFFLFCSDCSKVSLRREAQTSVRMWPPGGRSGGSDSQAHRCDSQARAAACCGELDTHTELQPGPANQRQSQRTGRFCWEAWWWRCWRRRSSAAASRRRFHATETSVSSSCIFAFRHRCSAFLFALRVGGGRREAGGPGGPGGSRGSAFYCGSEIKINHLCEICSSATLPNCTFASVVPFVNFRYFCCDV